MAPGGCTDLQVHRAGDSVGIAACKRDDYQVLTVLILLVQQLRGRVLYYLLARHTLVSGKICHAAGPNLLATMMPQLHRVHLVLKVGLAAVVSSSRITRLSSSL
jgi:hypothetical protein